MLSDLELLNKTEENLKWFIANSSRIRVKYAGKQIAIKDKAIVAFGNNGRELLDNLKNKNIDDSEVIIERIPSKGEIRIL